MPRPLACARPSVHLRSTCPLHNTALFHPTFCRLAVVLSSLQGHSYRDPRRRGFLLFLRWGHPRNDDSLGHPHNDDSSGHPRNDDSS